MTGIRRGDRRNKGALGRTSRSCEGPSPCLPLDELSARTRQCRRRELRGNLAAMLTAAQGAPPVLCSER